MKFKDTNKNYHYYYRHQIPISLYFGLISKESKIQKAHKEIFFVDFQILSNLMAFYVHSSYRFFGSKL